MDAAALTMIISILLYIAIGNIVGRRVRHIDDYFVAGRQAPTLFIVGTLIASVLSTNVFLGELGFTYSGYGPLILFLNSIVSIGYVVGVLFIGLYIRRSQALTVPQYFGDRFNSRKVQIVSGFTVVIGLTAYLLAVTQGASLIVSEVLEISYGYSLLLTWIGYTSFTFYSGSKGVLITDTVMFFLFTIVAFIAMYFIVGVSGGWFNTLAALADFEKKPDIIAWHGLTGPDARWSTPFEGLQWAFIIGLSWAIVIATSPWQTSRYLMARDEHTAIRSAIVASGILLFLYVALVTCGAAINLTNPEIEPVDKVMIWAADNILPTMFGAILIAGIAAAALSSASTFLSLIGFSISHDIINEQNIDVNRQLLVSRISMLLAGLIALLLAYLQPPSIMWITYFAGTLFASSWGPVAIMSIWSKTITANGAFWGILSGFIANAVSKLLVVFEWISLPVYLDPFVVGLLISTVTILIVSRVGKNEKIEGESEFREKIIAVPASECKSVLVQKTLFYTKALIAAGIFMIFFMLLFYALPYSRAVNEMESLSKISNYLNGEMLLSFWYGLSLLLCGVLANIYTKKLYISD